MHRTAWVEWSAPICQDMLHKLTTRPHRYMITIRLNMILLRELLSTKKYSFPKNRYTMDLPVEIFFGW